MKLKGIRRVRDPQTGKVAWKYHRASGSPLPADIPEDSEEFRRALHAAETGQAIAKPSAPGAGTLAAAWASFKKSPRFRGYSDGYKTMMEADARRLMAKAGTVPVHQLTARHIRLDLNKLEPHAAVKRRKLWRALLDHCIDIGLRDENPAIGVKKPATPKAQQRAPWTDNDIEMFRRRWLYGGPERLTMELIHWTGARISDACRMGPQMIDAEGWLVFTQDKTEGSVAIPFHREPPSFSDPADQQHLHRAIDALKSRHLTYMVTAKGAPRAKKAASQWFAEAVRKAGIEGKTAHGLRVRRAILLAEGGATTHQIGAWTGHESLQEVEHYSRQADKRRILSRPNVTPITEAKPRR